MMRLFQRLFSSMEIFYLQFGVCVEHDVFDGSLDVLSPTGQPSHGVVVSHLLPVMSGRRVGDAGVPARAKGNVRKSVCLSDHLVFYIPLTCCSWWWPPQAGSFSSAFPVSGARLDLGTDPEVRSWSCRSVPYGGPADSNQIPPRFFDLPLSRPTVETNSWTFWFTDHWEHTKVNTEAAFDLLLLFAQVFSCLHSGFMHSMDFAKVALVKIFNHRLLLRTHFLAKNKVKNVCIKQFHITHKTQ